MPLKRAKAAMATARAEGTGWAGSVGLFLIATAAVAYVVDSMQPEDRFEDMHAVSVQDRLDGLGLEPLALTRADGRFDMVIVAVADCTDCPAPDRTILTATIADAARRGVDLGYLAVGSGRGGTAAGAMLSCALRSGPLSVGAEEAIALLGDTVRELVSIKQYWLDRDDVDVGEISAALTAAEEETEAPLFAFGIGLGLAPHTALGCLRDGETRALMRKARFWLAAKGVTTVVTDLASGGSASLSAPDALATALAAATD